MRVGRSKLVRATGLLLVALVACDEPNAPGSSYFDERIEPALKVGCVSQTAGCHLASLDGTATGNLDLSSFDALMRRSDVLPAYGPYPVGLLLLKGSAPVDVAVETYDPPDGADADERVVRITTDVRHNAGAGIALTSDTSNLLKQWIANGHTRTGTPRPRLSVNEGECTSGAGHDPRFDPKAEPKDKASFDAFRRDVEPLLHSTCSGGTCHGSPIADLYLACGDTEEEVRWNYFIALQHVTTPASLSEILRRPLALASGGSFHEGGDVFASTEQEGYRTLRTWAEDVAENSPELLRDDDPNEGLRFFANRVQPVLVRKGCMFLNCHSPSMFHDLRLRGGSQGVFSRTATRRNYEMSKALLAYESSDPNDSRIIAKNLYPGTDVPDGQGMAHRGGFLFEDFGVDTNGPIAARADLCDGVDADSGDLNEIPAYCVLRRWHAIERDAAIASGELPAEALGGVVWVSRPDGAGVVDDFDTFRGGADLRFASAVVDDTGAVTVEASTSLLADCGLGNNPDVRTPAVSWDATRIAFAARDAASDPLRLYWMDADGANCEPVPDVAPSKDEENGILTHDFDPAFAPDGRIVFASTRGHLGTGYAYEGPTRTPSRLQPNANLYVFDPDAKDVRELTFLLNQELSPSFMADGRVIFTTEKRAREFHQFAGRRQNLDGGDYHPLFAQRDSVGFAAAREIIELPNRNLVLVAGPLDASDGAGTLAIVNRSIGPDQDDRPATDRFYIHSLSFPAPGAFGGMEGAFRSPAPLPGGRILASCDLSATKLTSNNLEFELCEIDPRTGAVRSVGGDAGRTNVEVVTLFARAQRGVFESRIDEANAHTRVDPNGGDAEVNVQDMPLLGTLLFANTREGRPIDRDAKGIEVFEALPPPADATSFGSLGNAVVSDDFGEFYEKLESLGSAGFADDGSLRMRIPGGTPIVLALNGKGGKRLVFADGGRFTGEMIQREQMQFYPGEHANQSLPRHLFNGLCGGCHGSITNRELDIAVNIDILTSASKTASKDATAVDLTR